MSDISFTKEGLEIAGELTYTWAQIDKERNYYLLENMVLVRVYFSYGRSSDLEDLWLVDKAKWENIHSCLDGRSAYFSDFAGKHSEVELNFWSTVGLEVKTDFADLSAFHSREGFSSGNMEIIMGALEQLVENEELTLNDDGTYAVVE